MASERTEDQQLRDTLSQVLNAQAGIVDKLDRLTTEIVNLSSRLTRVEKSVEAAAASRGHGDTASDGARGESVRRYISAVNSCSDKFNLLFHGLREVPGEDLNHTIRKFIHEKLGLDKTRCQNMPLVAQRTLRMTPTDAHPPVFVVFRMMGDFEEVRKKSMKQSGELRKMNMPVTCIGYYY